MNTAETKIHIASGTQESGDKHLLFMDKLISDSQDLIEKAAHGGDGQFKVLAIDMGLSNSAELSRRLSETGDLPVRWSDAVKIMVLKNDIRPIVAILDALGYEVKHKPKTNDEIAKQLSEVSIHVQEMMQNIAQIASQLQPSTPSHPESVTTQGSSESSGSGSDLGGRI